MSRKPLTTQEFIEKAKLIHGDRYDYFLVEYKNNVTKVKIICHDHGIFEQTPRNHLRGQGCPECAGNKKLTTQEFIEKSISVHGNKYDYSLVEYKNTMTKVKIICPEHGVFEQKPNDHLDGHGCPKCAGVKKLTTQEFIEKSKLIHGDNYDYSLVEYKNIMTKIKIICSEHGLFIQTPNKHLRGQGCPKCTGKQKLTTQEFIKKARVVHGNKYDYSNVNYVNSSAKIKIICPEHGAFEQKPNKHLGGQGCSKCSIENRKSNTQEFIKRARVVHGNKYDYSLVEYKNTMTKVKIICPEHGDFKQRPNDHLNGHGCPKCPVTISKSEQDLADYISSLGHEIIQSYRGWCLDRPQLEIDIFVPSLNLGFEFNGSYWHSLKPKEYHKEKTLLALDNNIKLIHIWEDKWKNNPESVKGMVKERMKSKIQQQQELMLPKIFE